MNSNNKKSICIIVDCLTGGGSEKVASQLSKSFYDAKFEVSIISMRDGVDYDYKGQLYNLGEINHKFGFIKSLIKIFKLKKYYKKINADIYLDFRFKNSFLKELILHLFVINIKKTVLTIHSHRVYNYLPQHIIFYKFYNRAKAVVVVSEGIYEATKQLFNFSNLLYIPNFYNNDIIIKSEKPIKALNKPFVIAVGRLNNEVKQFDKLIHAYKVSKPAKNNIPLYILGDGKDKENLESIINENNLDNMVKIMGFKSNPYPYIKASKFLLLSSKIEGFSMVILESLALGTPVVSFNCKSGPSEIIEHNQNGLLVKNQDFNAFTKAIDRMYSDNELYENCKRNSKSSIHKYSNDEVFKRWMKLIISP
ncbi:glycosyltransferase [Thalassobellus suaedae]|uniref:Glycosyltransferase n=1 Tax=Thalassobellus suaedae TaxID=3074124 RepID=A0ABY9Y4K9_9FLAO|nr:glycosyltransferase [Flavobacteriaceae bacterium HL-DH10]